MILFKPEHVQPILEGRKTQTRRLGKKRWNIGAVHQARTQLFGEPFALLRILAVDPQRLRDLDDQDARSEGYDSVPAYLEAFYRINRRPSGMTTTEWQNPLIWRVEFSRIGTTVQPSDGGDGMNDARWAMEHEERPLTRRPEGDRSRTYEVVGQPTLPSGPDVFDPARWRRAMYQVTAAAIQDTMTIAPACTPSGILAP